MTAHDDDPDAGGGTDRGTRRGRPRIDALFSASALPPGRAPTTDAERLAWLRLARSRGVGPIVFAQLLTRYASASAALEALPHLARRGGAKRPITAAADATVAAELRAGERLGARLLCLGAEDYPALLAEIDGAPPLLWALGDPAALRAPSVALVGSRNASTLGERFAFRLGSALAEAGWLIVSGLARGVDLAAHRGALETGRTAAALAGGVDVVYPREAAATHAAIPDAGALVSEMPFGLEPQGRHFPRRNRIISGLAQGVVVVEGALRSGSMITARFALEQGREAMAVPGHPTDPRAGAGNALIREGAPLIRSPEDVVEALSAPIGGARSGFAGGFREPAAAAFEEPPTEAVIDALREPVAALLGPHPVAVDALVRQLDAPAGAVAAALLELELAGRIERQPGGRVARAPEHPEET